MTHEEEDENRQKDIKTQLAANTPQVTQPGARNGIV
jgi:hypothetical protein